MIKITGEPVVDDRSIFKMISGKDPNKNPKVNVVGEKSIAVYSKGILNTTYIERGDISASDGAVALYADRTAIELGKKGATTVDMTNSPNLSVSGSEKAPGIMFYNYTYRDYIKGTLSAEEAVLEHPIAKGSFILNNDVNATIGNGGVTFYLIGKDGAKKTEILNDMFPDSKYGKTSAAGKKITFKNDR